MRVIVDPRVVVRHPEVSEQDVQHAVNHTLRSQVRVGIDPPRYVGVGPDVSGRMLQWIGFRATGMLDLYVYHAMPATTRVLTELGMTTSRRERHGNSR